MTKTLIPLPTQLSELPLPLARIDNYLDYWADRTPDSIAGLCEGEKITHLQLQYNVEFVAQKLQALGARDGDTIAVLIAPSIKFLVLFLAFSKIGAKWLGLNPKYTASEISYILSDAKPKIVLGWTGTEHASQATPEQNFIGLECIFDFIGIAKSKHQNYFPKNDIACLVYTSGTTGKPKAAQLSHKALIRGAQVRGKIWRVSPFVTVNNVPINHVGALGDICCTALVAGGCQVFIEKFSAAATLEAIYKNKVTYWYQAPTMFEMCMNDPMAQTIDWSNLQAAIWSGGRASLALIEKLSRVAKNLGVDYSMTESVGAISLTPLTRDMDLLSNSVGYPDPSRNLRIADPATCEIMPTGAEGEVQINDENMFSGYTDADANHGGFTADGWLKTGDLVTQNQDGSWRLTGRCKEMFKSGGYNVYPREIELALETHESVSQAAIVEIPNEMFGEIGIAFVVLKSQGAGQNDLKEHCQKTLANYKIPKHFVILENMPMLPIGKIDKGQLRLLAQSISQKV